MRAVRGRRIASPGLDPRRRSAASSRSCSGSRHPRGTAASPGRHFRVRGPHGAGQRGHSPSRDGQRPAPRCRQGPGRTTRGRGGSRWLVPRVARAGCGSGPGRGLARHTGLRAGGRWSRAPRVPGSGLVQAVASRGGPPRAPESDGGGAQRLWQPDAPNRVCGSPGFGSFLRGSVPSRSQAGRPARPRAAGRPLRSLQPVLPLRLPHHPESSRPSAMWSPSCALESLRTSLRALLHNKFRPKVLGLCP